MTLGETFFVQPDDRYKNPPAFWKPVPDYLTRIYPELGEKFEKNTYLFRVLDDRGNFRSDNGWRFETAGGRIEKYSIKNIAWAVPATDYEIAMCEINGEPELQVAT